MTTEQEKLLTSNLDELVFDVDYNTIRTSKVAIIDIVKASDFKYRYKDGKLLNYPINVKGSCWNPKEMYIYNSH